jgi:hypothetical protein
LARAAGLAVVAAVVALGAACYPDPTRAPATYCRAAKAAASKCKEPSSCDETFATSCASLDKVLGASTLEAAQDCLESGVCGAESCLTRSQKSATPSARHRELAESYCTFCAPDVADCETQFYSRKGRLPGALVLPYVGEVAAAVNEDCTGDRDTCRSNFAACANETIARVAAELVDADVAECVMAALHRDDEGAGPGGGPQVTTCTPANCRGCCRDDKCEDGTTEAACGEAAGACETCRGAQKCTAGKCKEPCGPNNCKGCCDGDTCVTGTTKDKCGGDGAKCSSCATEGSSFVCSNQTCIDGSCQATCVNGCCSAAGCQPGTAANACGSGGEACIDCGYGRTCGGAKACALDMNATWNFYVSFADLPEKDTSGASWDVANGAPDPYLVAYSLLGPSAHTGETKEQSNTTVPFWGEVPLKGVMAAELLNNLSFEVWDADVDFDDYIGGCKIPLTRAAFDGSLQSYTCPANASNGPVELYFRIQKP